MKRVHIDKRGSVTAALSIATEALLSDHIPSKEGDLIAAKVLTRSQTYGALEDIHGRMVELYEGDVVVGALGARQALHGHGGTIPTSLSPGDTLHMLNLGGVMGHCHTSNPQVGPPITLEVLGSVMAFPTVGSRQGLPANLAMAPLANTKTLTLKDSPNVPPVIVVSGTCMNAGKTFAACAIVRALKAAGHTIRAAKFTGVAAKKDVMAMVDCGALSALTFVDVGLPSTSSNSAPKAALQVLLALSQTSPKPDVIVVELGDGLLGSYGVMEILTNPIFQSIPALHVCCASDPVGAYGATSLFEHKLGTKPTLFTGPVTDNLIGCQNIESGLGVQAINALTNAEHFGDTICQAFLNLQSQTGAP